MSKFGQKKIKGAYVIDTIMNYNSTEGNRLTAVRDCFSYNYIKKANRVI